jgi:hypothetical protein
MSPPNRSDASSDDADIMHEIPYTDMRFVALCNDKSPGVFLKKHQKRGRTVSIVPADTVSRYTSNLGDNSLSDAISFILGECVLHGIGSFVVDISNIYTEMPFGKWDAFLSAIKTGFDGTVKFGKTLTDKPPSSDVELVLGTAFILLPGGWGTAHPDHLKWTGVIDGNAQVMLRSIFHSVNLAIVFSLVTGMTGALVQNPYLFDVPAAKKYATDSLVGAGYIVRDAYDSVIHISWTPAEKKPTKK